MSGLYGKQLDRIRWLIALVRLRNEEILLITMMANQVLFEVTPDAASRAFRSLLHPGISFNIEGGDPEFSVIWFDAGKVRWQCKVPVAETGEWVTSLESPLEYTPKRTAKQKRAMEIIPKGCEPKHE